MRVIYFAVLATGISIGSAQACEEWLENWRGAPYAQIRLALLDSGWEPVPGPPAEVSHDPALSLRKDYGWIEAISCAPSGVVPCSFEFNRGDDTLVIATIGEGWVAWVESWACNPW